MSEQIQKLEDEIKSLLLESAFSSHRLTCHRLADILGKCHTQLRDSSVATTRLLEEEGAGQLRWLQDMLNFEQMQSRSTLWETRKVSRPHGTMSIDEGSIDRLVDELEAGVEALAYILDVPCASSTGEPWTYVSYYRSWHDPRPNHKDVVSEEEIIGSTDDGCLEELIPFTDKYTYI
ncbi:uncharacterized protein B0I36DRAFT_356471 [Microdochium trichocladiopsis]|uniref:Uncharacterized protein n=1 Tax=Microdochium trichocladiopsis TaxID=1682393 RepID=A0A9P8XT95_9PEZI|nr:uncharacterized protein B0I36DRAFT_356471 [Microdochium trichocladiopsis]KAH7010874.1 hypothetical protein B0I36DRAFT_356471 [Microdochium trichocladiopsis]